MHVLPRHVADRKDNPSLPTAGQRTVLAKRMLAGLATLGLVAIGGCSGGNTFEIVPVSGVVTLNEKPLVNATVSFQPEGREPGPASYARTNEQGKFVLQTIDTNQPGAKVGKHRVSITVDAVADPGDDTGRSAKAAVEIPERYHRKSELTFDVQPPGSTSANFSLTSP